MGERGQVAEGVVHHSVDVVRSDQPEEGRLEGRQGWPEEGGLRVEVARSD